MRQPEEECTRRHATSGRRDAPSQIEALETETRLHLRSDVLARTSKAGEKKCHFARGLFVSFDAASSIASPFQRMKSLRPMRFFEITRLDPTKSVIPRGRPKLGLVSACPISRPFRDAI